MKNLRNSLIVFILLLFFEVGYGQQIPVDSSVFFVDSTLAVLKDDNEKASYWLSQARLNWPQSPVLTVVNANKALHHARLAEDNDAIMQSLFYLGMSFTEFNLSKAQDYLIEAKGLITQRTDEGLVDAINNNLGILYQRAGDHQSALEIFEKMLSKYQAANDSASMAIMFHNIAISQYDLNRKQLAMDYYLQASRLNLGAGNTENAIRNLINISAIYQDQNEYKSSLTYCLLADSMARAAKIDRLVAVTALNLSHLYEEQNRKLSILYAKEALALSRQQMSRNNEKIALQLISRYFADKQSWDSAYHYQHALNIISDSINKYDDLYAIRLLKTEAELNNTLLVESIKLTQTQNSLENTRLLLWIYLLGSLLFILMLGIVVYALRHRVRLGNIEKLKLVTHIQSVEKNLSDKNKELATHLLYAHKKNEMLTAISADLKKMNQDENSKELANIHQLISKLEKNSKEEIWPEFEKRFKEIHVDFYKNLTNRYPTLTPNELKLCAFLKLNLSNKEISAITLQSTDSIKIARHRLRTKLGLKRSENLVTILHQI